MKRYHYYNGSGVVFHQNLLSQWEASSLKQFLSFHFIVCSKNESFQDNIVPCIVLLLHNIFLRQNSQTYRLLLTPQITLLTFASARAPKICFSKIFIEKAKF